MKVKRWIAVGVVTLVIAGVSVLAGSSKLYVFQTSVYSVEVAQTSSNVVQALLGHDLLVLALGSQPTSNQVLAITVDCDTTEAGLIIYDASNSSTTTIAQTTSLDKVLLADPRTGITNQERFVAVFSVQSVGNLAGGYLTIAGRLHLDANGCPTTVLASKDHDRFDNVIGDRDVARLSSGRKLLTQRSGQAHLVGVLDVISNGRTNTVLIPSGHLSLCNQLD